MTENETIQREIRYHSRETEKLLARDRRLAAENQRLMREIELHTSLEMELAKKTNVYQRVLRNLQQQVKLMGVNSPAALPSPARIKGDDEDDNDRINNELKELHETLEKERKLLQECAKKSNQLEVENQSLKRTLGTVESQWEEYRRDHQTLNQLQDQAVRLIISAIYDLKAEYAQGPFPPPSYRTEDDSYDLAKMTNSERECFFRLLLVKLNESLCASCSPGVLPSVTVSRSSRHTLAATIQHRTSHSHTSFSPDPGLFLSSSVIGVSGEFPSQPHRPPPIAEHDAVSLHGEEPAVHMTPPDNDQPPPFHTESPSNTSGNGSGNGSRQDSCGCHNSNETSETESGRAHNEQSIAVESDSVRMENGITEEEERSSHLSSVLLPVGPFTAVVRNLSALASRTKTGGGATDAIECRHNCDNADDNWMYCADRSTPRVASKAVQTNTAQADPCLKDCLSMLKRFAAVASMSGSSTQLLTTGRPGRSHDGGAGRAGRGVSGSRPRRNDQGATTRRWMMQKVASDDDYEEGGQCFKGPRIGGNIKVSRV